MITAEIFSKCLPHTTNMSPGVGGVPDLTWEDVLQSIRGIKKHHEGFIRYIYLDDPLGKHYFFAGLFVEACSGSDTRIWARSHYRKIEPLVLFAMREWKAGKSHKFNDATRAHAFGVSAHTWRRHFKQVYSRILGAPVSWEDEVIQTVRKRLRR